MILLRNIFLMVLILGCLFACSDEEVKINGESYTYDRQEEIDWMVGEKTSNGIELIDASTLDSLSIYSKKTSYIIWDTLMAYEELDFSGLEFTVIGDNSIEVFQSDSMTTDTFDYRVEDDKYIIVDDEYGGFSWEGEDMVFDFSITISRRGFDLDHLEKGANSNDVLITKLSEPWHEVGDTASALMLRYYFTR